jgi:murein DD-endopeptidase MepM/ murein hydrolase activator NlpD
LAPLCILVLSALTAQSQLFQLPTANRAIFQRGAEEKYFVGTTGKPWQSGTFGCVRSDGGQMHEGLDIRCIQRTKRGEPTDPVMASHDGTVAYINRKVSTSNYGNYVVLRHTIEGMEVFTLYAHLSAFVDALSPGKAVKAGEVIATMGRTSNTRERISQERAHVHFEINLLVSERFSAWYKKHHPKDRDDHGMFNGMNLVGIDPRLVFLDEQAKGTKFSLVGFIRDRPELCRVLVRDSNLSIARRCPPLVKPNPVAEKQGVAGYELALDFNGVPIQIIPRAASEIKGKARFQLLSVNAGEHEQHHCRHLVVRRGNGWDLSTHGADLLDLFAE